MTVENWLQVGRHEIYAGPIFDAGIEAEENHIEVSAVTRSVCQTYTASERTPPNARSCRQTRHGGGEEPVKNGNANVQVIIQAPTLKLSLTRT